MAPVDNGASMARWDSQSQQAHGGQDIHLPNFVEDFSVTCNALGTPKPALDAAKLALEAMEHYPAADQEPALTKLAKFMSPTNWEDVHSRLIMGNGASELIDLVDRCSPEGPFRPGNTKVQYKEYERSAKAQGREILSYDSPSKAALTCFVNPTNPTGDWKDLATMKKTILETAQEGSSVMVDESMIFWYGKDWRNESLSSDAAFAKELSAKNINLYVMISWTKIWACPGLRIGSLLCPTAEAKAAIKKVMVPWSVNCAALKFVETVVDDSDYLDKTWESTAKWNQEFRDRLLAIFPEWKIAGEVWMSWIWVTLPSEDIAKEVVAACRAGGCPIRWGQPGYLLADHVRFGVRPGEKADVMIKILTDYKNSQA